MSGKSRDQVTDFGGILGGFGLGAGAYITFSVIDRFGLEAGLKVMGNMIGGGPLMGLLVLFGVPTALWSFGSWIGSKLQAVCFR